jgi:hypothetical protein
MPDRNPTPIKNETLETVNLKWTKGGTVGTPADSSANAIYIIHVHTTSSFLLAVLLCYLGRGPPSFIKRQFEFQMIN